MAEKELSILVFGAHPDDCDSCAGGMALKYRALGHRVRFVSMTNGDTGHYRMGGGPLARRRFEEAQAAARVAAIQYDVLDIHNGELIPSVANRNTVIRIMRETRPDLVLCDRPYAYHPDHRAVGVLVQDAAYIVTVPNVQPLTPHLEKRPVVGCFLDGFRKPVLFEPSVAVGIDDVIERKMDMMHCHVSQMYEWLPYNSGDLDKVPEGDAERRVWIGERRSAGCKRAADACRDILKKWYGPERGERIQHAEAVEISEYGARLEDADVPTLFPFFGNV